MRKSGGKHEVVYIRVSRPKHNTISIGSSGPAKLLAWETIKVSNAMWGRLAPVCSHPGVPAAA